MTSKVAEILRTAATKLEAAACLITTPPQGQNHALLSVDRDLDDAEAAIRRARMAVDAMRREWATKEGVAGGADAG